MKIARKYFPDTEIVILTNGLLLSKMTSDFWKCCKEQRIKITITKYPVKMNLAAIREIAKNAAVKLDVFYEDTERTFFIRPRSPENITDAVKNFMFCSEANRCIILRNGKISCTTASNIEILNNAMTGMKFEVSNEDHIDIYKVKSIDEILDFLAKPIPFCRYCDYSKITFGKKWAVSERKLSEWIL
jgi:hypothetical protein